MNSFCLRNLKFVFAGLLLVLPFAINDRYIQDIIVQTFLWAGLAASWNISCGYSRRFSIGHGAFLGVGAYTSTILYMQLDVSPWIGMIAGALISAIMALFLGRITLRLRGTFFVLTTIAFSELLRIFAINARGLTGGAMGLLLPFREGFFYMSWINKIPFAVITWVYMMALLILSAWLEKSRFGYSLIAIGQDKDAAETLGVDSTNIMVRAFMLSAALTSVGGTIFAQYFLYVEPLMVMGLHQSSLQFIMIAFIGGVGTAFGPMVGALLIIPLSIYLRGAFSHISGLHGMIYGVVLLLVVLVKPEGIIFTANQAYRWILGILGVEKIGKETVK